MILLPDFVQFLSTVQYCKHYISQLVLKDVPQTAILVRLQNGSGVGWLENVKYIRQDVTPLKCLSLSKGRHSLTDTG